MTANLSAGACRQEDPELFWPFTANAHTQIDAAKAVCRGCPVQMECLAEVESWPEGRRNLGMVAGGVYWPARDDTGHRTRVLASTP